MVHFRIEISCYYLCDSSILPRETFLDSSDNRSWYFYRIQDGLECNLENYRPDFNTEIKASYW